MRFCGLSKPLIFGSVDILKTRFDLSVTFYIVLFSFVSVNILLWDIPNEYNWIIHSVPSFFYNISGCSQLRLLLLQSWTCTAEAMGSGPGDPRLGFRKWVPEWSVPR